MIHNVFMMSIILENEGQKVSAMPVKVFMYHDIRDYKATEFGRRFSERYQLRSFISTNTFIEQIHKIKNESEIISSRDLLRLKGGDTGSYSVLTFDDGLLDHYKIQKILSDENVIGTFFLPCEAITKRIVMRSHKIQFILSATEETSIVSYVNDKLLDDSLWKAYSKSKVKDNWWSPEMVFITNILRNHSRGKELTDKLFNTFVTSDEEAFCDEFYLNLDLIKKMLDNGMEIGGHGYVSENLSNMTTLETEKDIQNSTNFTQLFNKKNLLFSYPNGGYNETVERCLKKYNYDLCFTTEQQIFNTPVFNHLRVPRWDAAQDGSL